MDKNKIIKFLNDPGMSEAIYQSLLKSFLQERPNADVQVLAASRLAVDYLNRAWRDLARNKPDDTEPKSSDTPYV